MNSRIEPKFRDIDDARGKLVSLTSGAGFRLLVKQALKPGEPLQINIGDGHLLVLSRYRLPVDLGHSFGVEGIAEGIHGWRPGETAVSAEEAPGQVVSSVPGQLQFKEDRGQLRTAAVASSARERRRLALGGIAAAIGISALGILWGGIRGDHANTAVSPFASQAQRVERTEAAKRSIEPPVVATSGPQPTRRAGSSAVSFSDRKFASEASMPMLATKALPVPPITRANAVPLRAPVAAVRGIDEGAGAFAAVPARRSAATVNLGVGPAQRISIKASSISWVTACADGVAVFRKQFNEGESAEIPFAHQASVHSGNAGAIELTIGGQSIGPMGKWGQVRTLHATPSGYEFVATTPARNCSETNPEN